MTVLEVAELDPRCLAALHNDAVAIRVRAFWDPERAARAAVAVLEHRGAWVSDFGGLQFCLGRAWYTHLETDREREYFAGAAEADALVERVVPGLQDSLRQAVGALTGGPVRSRRGWCGAGVHVFPAGGACAERGGDVHFDDEGLTRAQLRVRGPALSLVLMLQPPASGGGLRLWEARYEGAAYPSVAQQRSAFHEVVSGAGDLVLFDSLRLHQIQPFAGPLDRISATLHAASIGGAWESWF